VLYTRVGPVNSPAASARSISARARASPPRSSTAVMPWRTALPRIRSACDRASGKRPTCTWVSTSPGMTHAPARSKVCHRSLAEGTGTSPRPSIATIVPSRATSRETGRAGAPVPSISWKSRNSRISAGQADAGARGSTSTSSQRAERIAVDMPARYRQQRSTTTSRPCAHRPTGQPDADDRKCGARLRTLPHPRRPPKTLVEPLVARRVGLPCPPRRAATAATLPSSFRYGCATSLTVGNGTAG